LILQKKRGNLFRRNTMVNNVSSRLLCGVVPVLGVLISLPASAQTQNPTAGGGQAAGQVVGQAGTAAGQAVNQVGNTAGQVAGQLPGTVGQVGNAAGNVVGGLQPTLQPIGEGVGGALNNLTQPQTVSSLLEFLASVIPNHIEAHVNLDALRVEKLTVDVRGVDLRNLRVDLLVANSRGAGQARPVMGSGANSGNTSLGGGAGTSGTSGTNGSGTFYYPSGAPSQLNLNNSAPATSSGNTQTTPRR
jgi:hypothetical protein